MDSAKLTNWLQIGVNLSVFAGLLLVAVQISQTKASVQGAAYQAWVTANIELNMAFSEQLQAQAMADGTTDSGDLTEDTYMPFAMWNFGLMQMAQATDYLYRTGSIDQSLWETEIRRTALHISNPGVRQFWDAGAKTQLTPEFVRLIESTQPNMTVWSWESGRGFYPAKEEK